MENIVISGNWVMTVEADKVMIASIREVKSRNTLWQEAGDYYTNLYWYEIDAKRQAKDFYKENYYHESNGGY